MVEMKAKIVKEEMETVKFLEFGKLFARRTIFREALTMDHGTFLVTKRDHQFV